MKASTEFKVDMTIRCLVTALFLLIRYVTLWHWRLTFWPRSGYMAGHVVNPSTNFEDPTTIHSWVMTSDISHRISLTMRLPVSRDLCVGGKFSPYIWNPWPRFAYPLYNFYGATIKINGVIRQNSPTHAQNHFSLQRCPNLLPSSFSATTISR